MNPYSACRSESVQFSELLKPFVVVILTSLLVIAAFRYLNQVRVSQQVNGLTVCVFTELDTRSQLEAKLEFYTAVKRMIEEGE